MYNIYTQWYLTVPVYYKIFLFELRNTYAVVCTLILKFISTKILIFCFSFSQMTSGSIIMVVLEKISKESKTGVRG